MIWMQKMKISDWEKHKEEYITTCKEMLKKNTNGNMCKIYGRCGEYCPFGEDSSNDGMWGCIDNNLKKPFDGLDFPKEYLKVRNSLRYTIYGRKI